MGSSANLSSPVNCIYSAHTCLTSAIFVFSERNKLYANNHIILFINTANSLCKSCSLIKKLTNVFTLTHHTNKQKHVQILTKIRSKHRQTHRNVKKPSKAAHFSPRRHWLKLALFSLIHWLDVNSSRDLSAVHTNMSDEYVCIQEGEKFGAFSLCMCASVLFFYSRQEKQRI